MVSPVFARGQSLSNFLFRHSRGMLAFHLFVLFVLK
jgi:hypothetical protein